ncbi:hypothetical protein [Flavobacterium fluviatile]|uniref:hypothetical protein n=1 Tax=Flavobacterium fluviatile TaxID=1862387 RepID=UPI0013D3CCE2|nr:hypothetical protein [Flavobacterium fluviatile]
MREEINQRLEDLHNVLAYCSELQSFGKIYVFKVNERICINQERGSLLSQINSDNFPHEVRTYVIPASIEAKVKFTLEKIQATSWGGFNQEQFFKNDK